MGNQSHNSGKTVCDTGFNQVTNPKDEADLQNLKKMIVGLSGQCTLGTDVRIVGNDLDFCAEGLDNNTEWAKAQPNCWTCHPDSGDQPTIYSHGHESWHYWGCGISMSIAGFGQTGHSSYQKNLGREFGQHGAGSCNCQTNALNHWDTFYIRVRNL